MRSALLGRMIDRMREVNRIAAAQGTPAVECAQSLIAGSTRAAPGTGLDLELSPL
jgi:hypothetical protein